MNWQQEPEMNLLAQFGALVKLRFWMQPQLSFMTPPAACEPIVHVAPNLRNHGDFFAGSNFIFLLSTAKISLNVRERNRDITTLRTFFPHIESL